MKRFSAIITATTELVVTVEANSEEEAKEKINSGDVFPIGLWNGGLSNKERLNDIDIIDIVEESFGEDTPDVIAAENLSREALIEAAKNTEELNDEDWTGEAFNAR